MSSVVPITRLREWIATVEFCSEADTARLERLLDDVECASNPTTEDET